MKLWPRKRGPETRLTKNTKLASKLSGKNAKEHTRKPYVSRRKSRRSRNEFEPKRSASATKKRSLEERSARRGGVLRMSAFVRSSA